MYSALPEQMVEWAAQCFGTEDDVKVGAFSGLSVHYLLDRHSWVSPNFTRACEKASLASSISRGCPTAARGLSGEP
jgi:hypothetical protein